MTELEQKADNENINGTGLKIISLTGYQVMVPTNNLGNVYPISLVSINEADKQGTNTFESIALLVKEMVECVCHGQLVEVD